ncbi:SLAM family member 5-like [Hemiscyllium ocellatum]|uniref:SLAM family member 5-like n=1 Tax=Hemiscyllium ocellatum TaxID=170820 RepID=UPI002966BC77|nr:SLAM family member 5-like [Hemiscyllium ocellatum]
MATCNFNTRWASVLLVALLSAFCVVQSEDIHLSVDGSLGQSVSLPMVIHNRSMGNEIVWIQSSPRIKIARYIDGHVKYFGSEEYKKRIHLHPENFSLQINDLQREDAGNYEVIVTPDSGKEISERVRLAVYEPVTGAAIHVGNAARWNCNVTLRCSVTTGSNVSYTWWTGPEIPGKDSAHRLSGDGESLQVLFTGETNDSVVRCEARNPVSHRTAQIILRDVCHGNVPELSTGLSYLPLLLVIVLLVVALCLVWFWMKRAALRKTCLCCEASKKQQEMQDMDNTFTVSSQVQPIPRQERNHLPPEGNETNVMRHETDELPMTVYATIKPHGNQGLTLKM